MDQNDFYEDTKWCDGCGTYVRYLMSMEHSYCVECGGKVRLFNEEDWKAFNEGLRAGKAVLRDRRGDRGMESA